MSQKGRIDNLDVDKFMRNLNYTIKTFNRKKKIFFTSSVMVFIILLLTVNQFGAPNLEYDSYLLNRTGILLETDLWNVKTDFLN